MITQKSPAAQDARPAAVLPSRAQAVTPTIRNDQQVMNMKQLVAGIAALAIAVVSPAAAQTLITNSGGQLTGADGVIVNGASYDVEFVDGPCELLFNGCDSSSDFAFQTEVDASAAAQALLDQVFTGVFDTDYTLTFGCSTNSTGACYVFVPFLAPALFLPGFASVAANTNDIPDSVGGEAIYKSLNSADLGPAGARFVFARFTPAGPASAAPEPTTWAMMLIGLGAVGAAFRHRRRRESWMTRWRATHPGMQA